MSEVLFTTVCPSVIVRWYLLFIPLRATTRFTPPPPFLQASFASSGGHRALLQAGIAATVAESSPTTATATSSGASDTNGPSSAPARQKQASLALRRAILHALSSSVMGLAEGEGALCSEPGFQEFLARALSQEGEGRVREGGEEKEEEAEARLAMETSKLRSKAAFVLKVRRLASGEWKRGGRRPRPCLGVWAWAGGGTQVRVSSA